MYIIGLHVHLTSQSDRYFLRKSKLENEIKLLNAFVKHKSLQLIAENIHAITAVIPVAAFRNGENPTSRKSQ